MTRLYHTTNNSYPGHDLKRLLGIYIYYRLSMSVLLSVLFLSGLAENILGTTHPDVFTGTSFTYVTLCFISLSLYLLGLLKIESHHLLFLLVVDVAALVLMIFASAGFNGSLGYLLLIPMAIGSTFLKTQANIGLASFTTLLLISTSVINTMNHGTSSQSIVTASITGVLLFVTATSFRALSDKIQISQDTIQQQTEHADYLQRLGQRIVETIQTGIIVIDNQLTIQLINNAAKELLSHPIEFHTVEQIGAIHKVLLQWQQDHHIPKTMTFDLGLNHIIRVSFTNLSDNKLTSMMLFIEDNGRVNQEAQQLKLASLGRLTASIAHEIRNPLGAISHASQLLDESDHIHASDQELLRMIQANSQRIDQTINTILQLSKRKKANPETINICRWLTQFRTNYLSHNPAEITLTTLTDTIYCKVDPNHLQQIMTNLVDNGLRHSEKHIKHKKITISAGVDPNTKLPYIDIIDEGLGISEDKIHDIFEPFYTTEVAGSGLGLYLCKELCQANQADIIYFAKKQQQKSCFRLALCHYQRKTS